MTVPMREECKHFQSRTYACGEVARFCVLDLAPEAPWRCPENCPSYERRLADVGWVHGSLVEPAIEDEPGKAAPTWPSSSTRPRTSSTEWRPTVLE